MKRYLIAFMVLLCLGLAGLPLMNAALYDGADQIAVTEDVLFGDVSALPPLTVTEPLTLEHILFWDVTFHPGQMEQTETSFRFSRRRDFGTWWDDELGVVYFGQPGGFSISGDIDLKNMSLGYSQGYEDAIREVASRAPIGETYTEALNLKDYMDYLPTNIDIRLPQENADYPISWTADSLDEDVDWDYNIEIDPENKEDYLAMKKADEIRNELMELLKIPVPDDGKIEVTVGKTNDNTISELEVQFYRGTPGNDLLMDEANAYGSYSAVTKDTCFFTVPIFRENAIVCSLYRIDFPPDRAENLNLPNNLALLCELKLGQVPCDLKLSPDESFLELVTQEEDGIWLTIFDAGTGAQLQRLRMTEERSFQTFFVADGLAAVQCGDGHFAAAKEVENGHFEVLISGTLPGMDELGEYFPNADTEKLGEDFSDDEFDWQIYNAMMNDHSSLLWAGERLVVASPVYHGIVSSYGDILNCYLTVYGPDGLEYCGRYTPQINSQIDLNDFSNYGKEQCEYPYNSKLKLELE